MLRAVLTLEQVLAMPPDQASAMWLVRQDAAEDPNDERIFLQWLDADPAHGQAWARACAAWEELAGATRADIDTLKEPDGDRLRGWSRWQVAAAASIAFVAILGTLLFVSGLGPRFGPGAASTEIAADRPAARNVVSTEGARRTVRLGDGSLVTLNADTALAIAYDRTRRRIEFLRGQAFFDVAHDPGRPFIVKSANRSVTAVGTRFEVRELGSSLRVILVEGRVRVTTGAGGADNIVELQAGQQLDIGPAGITTTRADLASVTDWQQGMITFRDTLLSDAVSELNRYARDKRLLVRDPELAKVRISGAFHVDDPDRFARSIAQIYSARVIETPTGLEIVLKQPAPR